MKKQTWYVYMIETEKGSFYTGITTDLERRFLEHFSGKKGAKFFHSTMPDSIRYYETYVNRSLASKREAAIKKLSRKQKLILLDERELKDLVSVGPATLKDFQILKIKTLADLRKADENKLYQKLCKATNAIHDPCVIDVFRCAIEQAKDPELPQEKCQWFYWSKIRLQKSKV